MIGLNNHLLYYKDLRFVLWIKLFMLYKLGNLYSINYKIYVIAKSIGIKI